MTVLFSAVFQDNGRFVNIIDHKIQFPVIVQVAISRTVRKTWVLCPIIGITLVENKIPAVQVEFIGYVYRRQGLVPFEKDLVLLLIRNALVFGRHGYLPHLVPAHGIFHVAIAYEKVFPTIVVHIEQQC